jgi:formiminotetrahydrofolate cyclodeaminase
VRVPGAADLASLVADKISYSEYALVDLLDAFASNEPVPGGGSASAVAGALGVSLLMMVAGLPKTKSGRAVPEEAADLAAAASRLRPLRDNLITLVDRDSDAYRSILRAMAMPKESDAEKVDRRQRLQAALQEATDVPLETMRECQQALAGAVVVARNGLRSAASDVATAIELLSAAARSCALAIDANLKAITDRHYADRIATERTQLEADSRADAARARELLA